MLERLLVMYTAFMTFGNTGLMAHMVGPPGSGKSSVARQLADLLGVRLHIISVARLNPLETEGVQMPHGEGDEMRLRLLLAANWQRMRDGDIVLFDEFLRGFPEVYNALLDIFTSREVGGIPLPKVFMKMSRIAALLNTLDRARLTSRRSAESPRGSMIA